MIPQSINWYASLDDVKAQLCYSDTGLDTVVSNYLRIASRAIDDHCRRHFYVLKGNRIIQPKSTETTTFEIPDCLRIHELNVDNDEDYDYEDETWVYGTDYVMSGYQSHYPGPLPGRLIKVLSSGNYSISASNLYMINADWGYGNGYDSLPIESANSTCVVNDGTATTVTLQNGHLVKTGHTIYVDGEAMFVSSASTTTATVVRGVNGSTGTSHAVGTSAYIYRYPEMVRQCCIDMCVEGIFTRSDSASQIEVAAGQFQFARFEEIAYRHLRLVDGYKLWRSM